RYMRRIGPHSRLLRIPYATEAAFLSHRRRPRPMPSADEASAPLRLVFVGQFVHGKRAGEFVEALARVRAGLPGAPVVELTLVGHGPLQSEFEATARRLGRESGLRLKLAGPVGHEALPALRAEHDALVLPSAFETWGMVVNEAMAVGLPVLGARQAQAIEEMVRDGREGWVFDAGDPQSERRAIEALLRSTPPRRARMGRLARAAAARIDEEAVAARWCALVRELSTQAPAPGRPDGSARARLREQVE